MSGLHQLEDALSQSDALLQHKIQRMDVSLAAHDVADCVRRKLKVLLELVSRIE